MYVHEESFEGRKLHDVINERHENPKYLPGITLPENVVADSDIRRVVSGAHVLVFVMPHQFIKGLCQRMQGHVTPGAKAISLVKGFDCENNQINLMSEYIRKTLGIECCSLSGANVAEGVAQEQFRYGRGHGRCDWKCSSTGSSVVSACDTVLTRPRAARCFVFCFVCAVFRA